jgi:hypothetical protein
MATSAEIRQLVAVEGLAIGGQCARPGKAAQTGETCGMQAEQMELGV